MAILGVNIGKWGIIVPLIAWLISWLLYAIGVIQWPLLSWAFYGYFLFIIAGLFIGYSLGRDMNNDAKPRYREVDFERVWLPVVIIGVICVFIWVQDLKRGGFDAQNSINETAMVRHKHLGITSIWTTIASPFVCASFCGLSYIIYSLMYKRRNVGPLFFYGTMFTLAGFCYITFLQVSRNGILQFLILAVITLFTAGARVGVKGLRNLAIVRWVFVLAMLMAVLVYFSFISTNRQDAYQYESGLGMHTYRFDVIGKFPQAVEAPLIGGTYYFSHGLNNLDRLLTSGQVPVVYFDTGWLGYINQVGRRVGLDFEPNMERIEAIQGGVGIHPAEWATGFFSILLDFGLFGSVFFLSLVGVVIGYVVSEIRTAFDFSGLFFYVVLTSLIGQLILYYPGNQIFWISFYVAVLIFACSKIFKIKFI